MLQNKLNNIYSEALELILDAGIPLDPIKIMSITLNTRAKRRWGQCAKRPDGNFEININAGLVEQSEAGALNTVIHELLHTLNGGIGHNKQWQEYASIINNAYNINVKRTSTAEEKGVERTITRQEYKYILECNKCDQLFKRTRMSTLVNHPEHYKCSCGGSIKRIR